MRPHHPARSRPIETPAFLSFLLTALLIELTPGPNMAWLVVTAASEGRRAGFAAVAGIALGLAIVGAAAAAGLATLAAANGLAFDLLTYAGCAYLLWLAWSAWRNAKPSSSGPADAARSAMAWFRHGLTLNAINPKAAIFFVSVLPNFVSPAKSAGPQLLMLTAAYVAVATGVHALLVAFASRAHGWLNQGQRAARAGQICALLLAATALWLLLSAR